MRKVAMLLRQTHAFKLLLLLLSLDALFVALHVARVLLLPADSAAFWQFSVNRDGSFSELFQYLKFSLAAAGLLYLYAIHRAWTYVAWASVLAFALCDDALRIHEVMGRHVVRWLEITPAIGLRAQDFGELIVWGAVGIVAVGVLLAAYLRADSDLRRFSRRLTYRFALLVFFGLGLDLVHSALLGTSIRGIAVTEDGGEMLAVSLIVAFVWSALKEAKIDRVPSQHPAQTAANLRKSAA